MVGVGKYSLLFHADGSIEMFVVSVKYSKAFLITGLMQTGLFRPHVEQKDKVHAIAPDAVFTDVSGKTISLSSLKGKVVFLNFWATWCPPCRAEMPTVNELQQRFADSKNVVFLLVDTDGNFANSNAFLQSRNYNLPLFTSSSHLSRDLFSGTLPTTIVLNKKGEIVFRETGAANYSTKAFIDFVTALSGE